VGDVRRVLTSLMVRRRVSIIEISLVVAEALRQLFLAEPVELAQVRRSPRAAATAARAGSRAGPQPHHDGRRRSPARQDRGGRASGPAKTAHLALPESGSGSQRLCNTCQDDRPTSTTRPRQTGHGLRSSVHAESSEELAQDGCRAAPLRATDASGVYRP